MVGLRVPISASKGLARVIAAGNAVGFLVFSSFPSVLVIFFFFF